MAKATKATKANKASGARKASRTTKATKRTKATGAATAAVASPRLSMAGFKLEKNPSVALVYDVRGARARSMSTTEIVARFGRERPVLAPMAAGRPRVCADGDSWINILWPASALLGYDRTLFDVIEGRYDTANVAYPGDTFDQMRVRKDYRALIDAGTWDYFVFSGGGNDVLGGGALVNLLKRRQDGGGSAEPADYVVQPVLEGTMAKLREGYVEIAADVRARSRPKNTTMLVHGYDYAIPRRDGIWIGQPLMARGYDLAADRALITAIMKYLVDRFYAMLDAVARQARNVVVVDLRGVCRGRWKDELHPATAASRDFAKAFIDVFDPSPVG